MATVTRLHMDMLITVKCKTLSRTEQKRVALISCHIKWRQRRKVKLDLCFEMWQMQHWNCVLQFMSTHICSYLWTHGFHYFIKCTLLPTYTRLHRSNLLPLLFSCSSNHGDSICLQWLVGNVVGRDDTLYARMKQRDLDGHDSMWEPIFVDDAAIGLGDQKNKVRLKTISKMSNWVKLLLLLYICSINYTVNFI